MVIQALLVLVGVLRNSEGKILCQFSLSICFQDSNTAEIIANQKPCNLCSSNLRLAVYNIQIASDSRVAVSWANNSEDYGSFHHFNAIYDIRDHLQRMEGLSIIYNSRSSNGLVDSLAKRSSNGGDDSLVWMDF
ncbi:hypothetical protein QYF36_016731 [Acer negundo]|nr:hypothetical protein QYF36_016731 [Acer negundo]